jgi:ATP-dependent helicase HrpB
VTAVVDTGLARVLRFHAGLGLDRLEVEPISRASADQRAGRAGRTKPGICIRLWDERHHRSRAEQTESEIRRVDLAGAVLELLALGETDVAAFPWLEAPSQSAITQAISLLRRLGALEDSGLTDLGRSLARLPLHPRIGRMLIEGQRLGHAERVALAASLLAERDPFLRSEGTRPSASRQRCTDSDVLDRVEALEAFEHNGQTEFAIGTLHVGGARFVLRARDQLARLLDHKTSTPHPNPPPQAGREEDTNVALADDAVLRSLLAAFPDRVARRRNPGGAKGIMVGGRGVKLAPWCGVKEANLFVCVDVDAGSDESLVRQASAIRRDWLPLTVSTEINVEPSTGRITASKRTRFLDLLIEETQAALPEGDELTRLMANAARKHLERVLPPSDSAAGKLLVRVRCLHAWMPELDLPAFDDGPLSELLPWVCAGCRSFDDVRKADWLGILQGRLTHAQLQAVDREAPERIEVPSGSRIQIQYEEGRPPVLAVRIQEVFGLADTPRIAGGRVKLLLHLLAPNFRAQQVTDDLASFWANTYPAVRKELRARYPKHAWPEDPRKASAQRGSRSQ